MSGKTNYPESEIKRQTKYIIDIGGSSVVPLAISVEEAKLYLNKYPLRKAVVLSDFYRNDDIKTIKHNANQNTKQGSIHLIKLGEENLYERLNLSLMGLKSAFFIVGKGVELTNESSKMFLKHNPNKAIDFVIHRSSLEFFQSELEFIGNEIQSANLAIAKGSTYRPQRVILLRIHNNPKFPFTIAQFKLLLNKYGTEHGYGMFLAQYIAEMKTVRFGKLIKNICKENNEEFKDFIDPKVYSRKADNFVLYNFLNAEITGVEKELIAEAKAGLKEAFGL